MANHPSALKAHRQSIRRRNRNRSNRRSLRTYLKKFNQLLASGKLEEAKNSLPRLYSIIDKSKRKKAITENAAARKKSRLTRRLYAMLADAGQA